MQAPRILISICFVFISLQVGAQTNIPATRDKLDDVVRINTQLVQTDVIVLDHGKFVNGLKPQDLTLRVNGKPRPIVFVEELTAGTANEEVRLAAARGQGPNNNKVVSLAVDRGRTILFYLDDFHLSSKSVGHAKEMLLKFIDTEMRRDDEVGIFTGTGQLGFLEQFSNEKVVLRRAVEKLKHRTFQNTDAERPPMSETEAMAIMNEDRRILDYFVEQLLRDVGQPRTRQPSAATRSRSQYETLVRGRAKSIVDQVAALTNGSLTAFEKFIRASGQLPWQKLAFFISDGFQIIEGNNSSTDLRRIADAASHSATVIYSIDARGLISGATDASRKMPFDYTGRLASSGTRPITASQEPLRTLALDAGGLPIIDTNEPIIELRRALSETKNYYQLAWRPEEEDLQERRFQTVEVTVANQPNLSVRLRRGFFLGREVEPPIAKKKENAEKQGKSKEPQERPLATALRNHFVRRELPVALSTGFIDTGEPDLLVTASLEVARDALALGAKAENIQIDVAGVVINDRGEPVATFDEDLTVKPAEMLSSSRRVAYNHQLRLPPGLYQVRVALQEKKTGRMGGATQWLDLPNAKSGSLLLSSVFIGEVDAETLASGKLNINADHRFPLQSRIGFLTYVYNAQPGASGADIAIQVIILRDDQPVMTKPLVKVSTAGIVDPLRIPYGEDFDLGSLPAGRYVLQINAIDRHAQKTATQDVRFSIH